MADDTTPQHVGIAPEERWYSVRHVIAASFSCLLLGLGAGTAYSTQKYSSRAQDRFRFTEVDQGFVNDMLDHHDQAVEMSLITLDRPGISAAVKRFATEVIVFQRYEIGLLEARLDEWGVDRGAEDRVAMAWMGMGTTVVDMPGMASSDDLLRLKNAAGVEADREFLTLMRAHHKGGVHMAEFARDNASDAEVAVLATRMATDQKLEVEEYTKTLNGLVKP